MVVAFQFRHELTRLRRRFPHLPSIDGRTSGKDADMLLGMWNQGQLPMLAVQPQSLSHGVNMQSGPGRDVIWFGLTDNLETYQQLNKRIYRQGVDSCVRIHRVLANKTIDLAVRKILNAKDSRQTSLLDALDEYREGL